MELDDIDFFLLQITRLEIGFADWRFICMLILHTQLRQSVPGTHAAPQGEEVAWFNPYTAISSI